MTESREPRPALLFDLDGTLVDSVYQHVLAWREALSGIGVDLAVWRIHRKIGMSGGLLVNALLRETGRELASDDVRRLQAAHAAAFERLLDQVRPLPGASRLLQRLGDIGISWAIATSGGRATALPALDLLGVVPGVVVTREEVPYAKPDPHLFLEAARRLGVDVEDSIVVGDSVWDMLAAQRARALGVGLLTGGYGREELERAGAFRVYDDPADLDLHIDELGVRSLP
jgi:HAD superfamily hydrolase (TIGR01509 family)